MNPHPHPRPHPHPLPHLLPHPGRIVVRPELVTKELKIHCILAPHVW